jgi:cation-dependent mannose-6-phosphate receptor
LYLIYSQKNTTLSFPASLSPGRAVHPHLTLASGSKCRDSDGHEIDNLRGSTEIEFICDPSVAVGAASAVGAGSDLGVNVRAGGPRLVAQLPPGDDEAGCAWVFEWRTAVCAYLFFAIMILIYSRGKAACPTSEGVTFGGVIWFLFVS